MIMDELMPYKSHRAMKKKDSFYMIRKAGRSFYKSTKRFCNLSGQHSLSPFWQMQLYEALVNSLHNTAFEKKS